MTGSSESIDFEHANTESLSTLFSSKNRPSRPPPIADLINEAPTPAPLLPSPDSTKERPGMLSAPAQDLWSNSISSNESSASLEGELHKDEGSTNDSEMRLAKPGQTDEDLDVVFSTRSAPGHLHPKSESAAHGTVPGEVSSSVPLGQHATTEMAPEAKRALLKPEEPVSEGERVPEGMSQSDSAHHAAPPSVSKPQREVHELQGTPSGLPATSASVPLSPSIQRVRLVLLDKGIEGHTWYLQDGQLNIGRDLGNEVVLDDPGVSHRHAQLATDGNRFTIADLGSLNGTYLNGNPVIRRPLTHGDLVQVGDSTLRFGLVGVNRSSQNQQRPVAQTFGMLFGMAIPGRWLLAMGLCTLVAVMVTLLTVRALVPPPQLDPKAEAQHWLDEAKRSEESRDWLRAKDDFKIAQLLAPELTDFGTSIARVVRENKNLDALSILRRKAGRVGEFPTLNTFLDGVDRDSVYRTEAESLFAQTKEKFVVSEIYWLKGQWLKAGKAELRERFEVLRRLAPNDPRVSQFASDKNLSSSKKP